MYQRNEKKKFCIWAYKNDKRIKIYVNTCVQIAFSPKKPVNDNCSVQNLRLQTKQRPFQVQKVLFIMLANSVCKKNDLTIS
jgi:hypothetical protein